MFFVCLNREFLKCFTTPELMNWSNIQETYGNELRNGTGKVVFDTISDDGNKTWEELRKRVVEHVRNYKLIHVVIF